MRDRFDSLERGRLRAYGVAVAVVLAVAPGAAACAAGQAKDTSPTLTLRSRNPVTVVGRHFIPHRRVRLMVSASGTQSRRVVANASGSFTATFSAVAIDRCTGWSVTASQRGLRPVVIHVAKPECLPAGMP